MPARSHILVTPVTASDAVSGRGIRMHQRPTKSSAKPDSGPECSVPATGWPGTKWTRYIGCATSGGWADADGELNRSCHSPELTAGAKLAAAWTNKARDGSWTSVPPWLSVAVTKVDDV